MLKYENRLPLVFVTLLVLFGVWQHLWFSWTIGEFAFFKNAYDEDTYALFPDALNTWRLDRVLSTTILKMLLWVSGGSYDLALVAADAFLPPLAFLSAYFLAAQMFRSASARALCALTIIFAPDLFSLGNAVTFTSSQLPIAALRLAFGPLGEQLVPPIETSYINLIRSFEPQVSYAVGFLFAGLLVRIVRQSERTVGGGLLLTLAAVQSLLLLSYSVVGYPLLILELYVAALLGIWRSRRAAAFLALLFIVSAAIAAVSAMQTLDGGNAMFQSRLPTISVAVIGGLFLCVIVAWALWSVRFSNRLLWLALGLAGLPIAVMNQQILTGVMVSTKDWERYINHPTLVISASLFLAAYVVPRLDGRSRRRLHIAAPILCAAVIAVVVDGSRRSYSMWASMNIESVAIARAVDQASATLPANTLLVLDNVSLAPLVATRRNGERNFLADYTNVFLDRIPSSSPENFKITRHGYALFEYWRLIDRTPEAVDELLRSEASMRGGFFSAFFFNVCEYWYPCTDSRDVKVETIAALIPVVVDAYRSYLTTGGSQFSGKHFVLVETAVDQKAHGHFSADPIARETVAGVAASVYLQN